MTFVATVANVVGDLSTLVGDVERSLRASNKSDRTVEIYGGAARRLIAFLREKGMPTAPDRVSREHIEASTAEQLARFKPATATQRYWALGQLFKWLAEQGEIRSNPFDRMKPPRVSESPVPVLTHLMVADIDRDAKSSSWSAKPPPPPPSPTGRRAALQSTGT